MSTTSQKSTALPPISDILRTPAASESYFPPQAYGSYRAAPVLPAAVYSSAYQLASPEYGAPRFYNTPYAAPSYSFAGETGYGHANPAARDASRHSWGSSVDASHRLPSPVQMPARDRYSHGPERTLSGSEATPGPAEYPEDRQSVSPRPLTHVSESGHSTKGRTRNNLPKEVTSVLLQWLNEHLNHPYPNSFEKAQLIMATGLNQQQLSNWFINARRRKIKFLREKSTAQ